MQNSRATRTTRTSSLPPAILTLALLLPMLAPAQSQLSPAPQSQPSHPVITLAQSLDTESTSAPTNSHLPAREFRTFSGTKIRQTSAPQLFTLEFHQTTRITSVTSTPDFKITGGTCSEGHTFSTNDRCTLDIAFTPQGPGHRTGKLTVAHSASPKPFTAYLGGTSYGPTVSFVPSLISTVPGTYKGGVTQSSGGVLLSPQSLAIDGGDNLYIADTGNRLIRFIDSSGALTTLAGGGSSDPTKAQGTPTLFAFNTPYGVTVDPFGTVYFSDFALNQVYEITQSDDMDVFVGYGTGNVADCTYAQPCTDAFTANIQSPNALAVDPYGNLFVNLLYGQDPQYFPGSTPLEVLNNIDADYFTIKSGSSVLSTTNPIAVDAEDNLFYTDEDPGAIPNFDTTPTCHIDGQNQAASYDIAGQQTFIVAGSGPCGFSGDGGKATGAQISNNVRGLTFDVAGNLYFTDAGNNRVRRIDALTGIIRTVAGNGSTGFGGDGGPATSATLNTPTGIAVDSQGQIYTTNYAYQSHAAGTPYPTDIRVIGTIGTLTFPSQATATLSGLQTVLVSNTGNDSLNISSISLTSGNIADFIIDPVSTTCHTTAPLSSGHNCQIGVYFKPTVSGARSAQITIYDDTVNNSNLIQLTGTGASTGTPAKGTLSPTSLAFASQTVATTSAGKTITLSNSGTAALGVTSFAFSGTNPADFAQTNTCGTSVAASGSCSISVTFTPAAAGSRSATLSVVTAAGTLTEAITGTGVAATKAAQAALTPATLTFTSTAVGSASATQVLTLSNPGGANLTISGYAFGGTNPTSFSQSHDCGNTLVPNGHCAYTVTFKPTAAGALTATISVTTSAGVVSSTLNGTGTAAAVKPKVTLISKANPAPARQAVLLTATVASASTRPPTGTVQLKEGSKILAETTLIEGNAQGNASFRLLNLATGTHTLTAVYMGDALHPASQSAPVQQIVRPGVQGFLP